MKGDSIETRSKLLESLLDKFKLIYQEWDDREQKSKNSDPCILFSTKDNNTFIIMITNKKNVARDRYCSICLVKGELILYIDPKYDSSEYSEFFIQPKKKRQKSL